MSNTLQSDSGFTPRKEFIKSIRVPNTFSLVVFSGSNLIKLYSFPDTSVAALRNFLDLYNLTLAYSEDVNRKLCEFTVDGKPWANQKSPTTEKLLVDVVTIIYQQGHILVSSIEYGRDVNDRLVMTFSKPEHSSTSSEHHLVRPSSPHQHRSRSPTVDMVSAQSYHSNIFALSFDSGNVLRVINPPLSSTPAILQSIRSSWPRGVLAERKLGDGPYEFKLKAPKWYEENTSAQDTTTHVQALFSSLDSFSFTFLASISLPNRSRMKDLWIFSGPSSSDMLADSPEGSSSDLRKETIARDPSHSQSSQDRPQGFRHVRSASSPSNYPPAPQQPLKGALHHRVTSETARKNTTPANTSSPPLGRTRGSVLRKPVPPVRQAPDAQVPESVAADGYHPLPPEQVRTEQPVSPNLAGVGANGREKTESTDLIYETGKDLKPAMPSRSASAQKQAQDGDGDPLHDSEIPSSSAAPLLGSKVFGTNTSALQDSDGEDNVDADEKEVLDCEIPAMWTGGAVEGHAGVPGVNQNSTLREMASVEHMPPGGWQPTPDEVNPDSTRQDDQLLTTQGHTVTQVHDVDAHVETPEVKHVDVRRNKSQVGIVEMIPPQRSPHLLPPLPPASKKGERGKEKEKDAKRGTRDVTSQGWVLVTIEAKGPQPHSPASPDPGSSSERNHMNPNTTPPTHEPSMPPAAPRTVALMDTLDPKSGRGPANMRTNPLKRLFSISRGNKSNSPYSSEDPAAPRPSQDQDRYAENGGGDIRGGPRNGLRSKLRKGSRAEATTTLGTSS